MNTIDHISMLARLRDKTEAREALWQKGSRSNEFSITFKTGSLVIDTWHDEDEGTVYCDFEIYNSDGDKIYSSGPIGPKSERAYETLKSLHDTVYRCYYKVDETIRGFADELEHDGVVGEKPSEEESDEESSSSSASSEDEDNLPF